MVSFVLASVLRRYRHDMVRLAKIRAITVYVKTVQGARLAFIAGLLLAVCLCVLLTGFLLIHAAVLLYLPWTLQEKALALLVCGTVYLLAAVGVLLALTREKLWMRVSKARDLVDQVTSEN